MNSNSLEKITQYLRDIQKGDLPPKSVPIDKEGNSEVQEILKGIEYLYKNWKVQTENLEEKSRFLDSIVQNLPHMVFIKDALDLRFVLFNKAGEDLLGLQKEELIGKSDFDFFPTDQADFFQAKDRSVLNSNTLLDIPEEPLNTADGKKWLHTKKVPILDKLGKPAYLLGISEDITKQRQILRDLKETNQKIEYILNSAPDGIYGLDTAGKLTFINPSGKALLGWEFEEFGDQSVHSRVHHSKTDGTPYPIEECPICLTTSDGKPRRMSTEVFWRKDGSNFPVDYSSTPIINEENEILGCVVSFRDITRDLENQKQIESQRAQLVQASRLSALGEMAGGISHEINNPLTIIQGSTRRIDSILQSGLETDLKIEEVADHTKKILSTIQRISTIIRGMRNVGRDGSHDSFEKITLQRLIEDTLGFCREKFISHGVKLTIPNLETQPTIECRTIQLSQVLINLLNNAFYAAQEQQSKKKKWVKVEAKDTPDIIELSITDSGEGIPQADQEKIFNPFFTTKPVGSGTGLGLSTCTSIVQEHSGELFLDTRCKNTRFVLKLPKSQQMSKN